MPNALKRLTLVAPRALEANLASILLEMQPALPGFTTAHVAGHGEGFERARVVERVQGRIERVLLWLVLPAETVDRVLSRLCEALPHSEVVWWVEPVEKMGRLA
jgi:nitrogen regulatory protein PII